jgi:hypothetical protein
VNGCDDDDDDDNNDNIMIMMPINYGWEDRRFGPERYPYFTAGCF